MLTKYWLNLAFRKPKYLLLLLIMILIFHIQSLYLYKKSSIYVPLVSVIQNYVQDMNKIVILTFTNFAQIHIVKHFLCNLKNLNLENQIIVIATDKESLSILLEFKAFASKVLFFGSLNYRGWIFCLGSLCSIWISRKKRFEVWYWSV